MLLYLYINLLKKDMEHLILSIFRRTWKRISSRNKMREEIKMTKKSKLLLIFGLITMMLLLAACGDDDNGSVDGNGNETGDDTAGDADYPSTVTIGTASQGGTYYIWGGGLANLLEEHLDIVSNVEVTGGPVHNIKLLDVDDIQVGMVTVGPMYEGVTGEGDWAEKEYVDTRVIFPMYHTPFHWWSTSSSGVTSIMEHEGERVGVGP